MLAVYLEQFVQLVLEVAVLVLQQLQSSQAPELTNSKHLWLATYNLSLSRSHVCVHFRGVGKKKEMSTNKEGKLEGRGGPTQHGCFVQKRRERQRTHFWLFWHQYWSCFPWTDSNGFPFSCSQRTLYPTCNRSAHQFCTTHPIKAKPIGARKKKMSSRRGEEDMITRGPSDYVEVSRTHGSRWWQLQIRNLGSFHLEAAGAARIAHLALPNTANPKLVSWSSS